MEKNFDVIILGLGAMGSSCAYNLSQRGLKVLGVEQFSPAHSLGSSHGQSRVIREAYFEHPLYVPLVQRSYELWEELESKAKQKLLWKTGGLMVGSEESVVFQGALKSALEHNLPYKKLNSQEIRERLEVLHVSDDMVAILEPRAGFLCPEKCIESFLNLAQKQGADLHFSEKVLSWQVNSKGVSVTTSQGEYKGKKIILSAGAWLNELVPACNFPLQVHRQTLFWFTPEQRADYFASPNFPIYICEYDSGKYFYGFPDLGEGVKVAFHHIGPKCEPNQIDREVKKKEVEEMRSVLQSFMPELNGPLAKTSVCMYTMLPDSHFLIDFHPQHTENVLILSPCSGHGFKFASVVGEIASDLIEKKKPPFDIELFRAQRFFKETIS